jgi:uncharacterized protein
MNFTRLTFLTLVATAMTACGVGEADINMDEEVALEGVSESETALTLTQAKFQTFVGKDGQHYFHLIAGNGQKLLGSEGYTSITGAKNGIASVKTNAALDSKYLLREAADGSQYFVLAAGNGQIIAVSQMYSTVSNRNRAIDTIKTIVGQIVAQEAAVPAPAKFEIFKGLDGKYYFNAKAGNGEIVLQSQGYSTRASATNGVTSVQSNGASAARYTVLEAADGRFYFNLKATNGQIIARGQLYSTRSNAQRGVDTCVALLSTQLER